MAFGIGCGDGWFELIWDLCADLELIARQQGRPVPAASQVKEKYGGLRFYVRSASHEMHDRIEQAENESVSQCETCGVPGRRLEYNGWVYIACEKHKKR